MTSGTAQDFRFRDIALVAYGLSSEAARGFVARCRHLIERAIGGVLVALGLGLAASSLQRG